MKHSAEHPMEPLKKPREMAALLGVSRVYLRNSECPKVLLPGNGRTRVPLVRYRESEVRAWLETITRRSIYRKAS